MSRVFGRSDRTARLLKLQILLWQYPDGIKISEIARLLSVSSKTVYRDMNALEHELKIPIWEEGSKRGIAEGYFLPPIHFTLPEAVNILLQFFIIRNTIFHFSPEFGKHQLPLFY